MWPVVDIIVVMIDNFHDIICQSRPDVSMESAQGSGVA